MPSKKRNVNGSETIVAEALRGFRVDDAVRRSVRTKQRQRGFSEYDIVESIVMLLAAGGEHMEDMDLLREDAGLCRIDHIAQAVPAT